MKPSATAPTAMVPTATAPTAMVPAAVISVIASIVAVITTIVTAITPAIIPHGPIPRVIGVVIWIIIIRRSPAIVIVRLTVRNDIRRGRRRGAGLCNRALVVRRGRLSLLRLRLLLLLHLLILLGSRGHSGALVQHRINHRLRHTLLFQINYLRRIKPVNSAGILNIGNDGAVTDFRLRQLENLIVRGRQRRGRNCNWRGWGFGWRCCCARWRHFMLPESVRVLGENPGSCHNHQCGGCQHRAFFLEALCFHNITTFLSNTTTSLWLRIMSRECLRLQAGFPNPATRPTGLQDLAQSVSTFQRLNQANACGSAAGGPTRRA
jgi:hypothetical protein